MYPEYFKLEGVWRLATESRMDASVVWREDGRLDVVENRNLKQGDRVILGRTEKGTDGIYLHTKGFENSEESHDDQFVFRQGRSRETSYARDYDHLMELLRYEKEHGNILWVMGPAFAFDYDARRAMQKLIENGYAHGLLGRKRARDARFGGRAAAHRARAGYLHAEIAPERTLQPSGRDQQSARQRLDSGSLSTTTRLTTALCTAAVKNHVPFVLTGSIRDDGPLPEVIGDAYKGQGEMRKLVKKCTTIICLATMLHTIAAGNMTPSFRVLPDGTIRPVYLYSVDADEFVVNKLLDRGSLAATTIVTNVQDFITILARGLGVL